MFVEGLGAENDCCRTGERFDVLHARREFEMVSMNGGTEEKKAKTFD